MVTAITMIIVIRQSVSGIDRTILTVRLVESMLGICCILGLIVGSFLAVTSSIELHHLDGHIREAHEIIAESSRLKEAISTIDTILNKPTLDESIRSYFTTVASAYRMPVCEVMKNATDWLVEAARFLDTLEERHDVKRS
jgi:hypothetical protein